MTNVSSIEQSQTGLRCPIKQRELNHLLAGREPFDDLTLWERCFKPRGVAFDTVTRVRRILCDILEVDLFLIRAKDSLSKELAFLWELDSLADLKIVHALEEEFNIAISDAEAEAMKTLLDIIMTVHGKIVGRPKS